MLTQERQLLALARCFGKLPPLNQLVNLNTAPYNLNKDLRPCCSTALDLLPPSHKPPLSLLNPNSAASPLVKFHFQLLLGAGRGCNA